MWASVNTNTCHRSQVWSPALPAARRAGLPKGLQAAGSVDVGKLANAGGRRKDRTSLLPGGLTLRPSRQFSQNPSALLACGSLSAFFPFSVSALVAGSPFPQERESPLSLNPLPRDPPIPPSPVSHPFSSYLWVGLPR